MKISEILKNKKTLSFEVFPPKKEGDSFEKLLNTIKDLKKFNPDFISVTYGASGTLSKNTVEIASFIKNEVGIEALAHITGGPSSKEEIDNLAKELINNNIENVLALRGDKPVTYDGEYCKVFKHATDLQEYLKKYEFGVAGACYPEGHIESETLYDDLYYMKKKEELGAEFFITQLFYDNSYYYRLVNEARKMGINSPIIPGIMPLVSSKNIKRIKSMCGSAIPLSFRNMIEIYKDNDSLLEEIGINYAVYQIIDLLAMGAPGVHIYIMNNIGIAEKIYMRLEHVFNEFFKAN